MLCASSSLEPSLQDSWLLHFITLSVTPNWCTTVGQWMWGECGKLPPRILHTLQCPLNPWQGRVSCTCMHLNPHCRIPGYSTECIDHSHHIGVWSWIHKWGLSAACNHPTSRGTYYLHMHFKSQFVALTFIWDLHSPPPPPLGTAKTVRSVIIIDQSVLNECSSKSFSNHNWYLKILK